MHFFTPLALAFLVLIPLIILMYLLRQRRQDHRVSSTLLWQQALRDLEANAPWQRLQKNLLLLLQILVAALLALALARPYLPLATRSATHLVVLVDTSASMMATDVRPDRMASARAAVERLITELGPRDMMTVIKMGVAPEVVAAASREKGDLQRQVARLSAGYYQANLDQALALVSSLIRHENRFRVVIVSDGTLAPLLPGQEVPFPVSWLKIGTRAENTAVIALAAQSEGSRTVALARVKNFGAQPARRGLELYADGRLLDYRELVIDPGGEEVITWNSLPGDSRLLQARLTGQDYLDGDDRLWAAVESGLTARALLVTKGNVFLERALALVPGLQVFKTAPATGNGLNQGYDLFVLDGWWPPGGVKGNILLFNPPVGRGPAPVRTGTVEGKIILTRPDDPLLKYVEAEGSSLYRARPLALPNRSRTLLTAGGKPVTVVGEGQDGRFAVFGFDLHNSDLPLKPSFPILIHNLTAWLLPGQATTGLVAAPGELVTIPAEPRATLTTVTDPRSRTQTFNTSGPVRYRDTQLPGVYRVTAQGPGFRRESYLVVNFPAAGESLLKPQAALRLGDKTAAPPKAARLTNQEVWPYLAWGALLLLAAEWWVYYRGH